MTQRTHTRIHVGSLIILMVLSIAIAALNFSCDAREATTGSITFYIDSERAFQGRNIDPSGQAPLVAASFSIHGEGPGEASFDDTVTSQAVVTIENLPIGNWTFTVTALNAAGAELVQGTVGAYVAPSETTVELILDELLGSGTLDVDFSWNPEQTTAQTTLELTVTGPTGTSTTFDPTVIDRQTGTATLTTLLDAGFHSLRYRLIEGEDTLCGGLETVRIIDGTVSSGSIDLTIGGLVDQYGLTVIDNTMMPIDGTVTCSPEVPLKGQPFTLSFTPQLPEGVTVEELNVAWYCEGTLITGADDLTLEVAAALGGTHRYDIVLSHASHGSVGSKAFLVTVEVNPVVRDVD
jgi:hypothetical protein